MEVRASGRRRNILGTLYLKGLVTIKTWKKRLWIRPVARQNIQKAKRPDSRIERDRCNCGGSTSPRSRISSEIVRDVREGTTRPSDLGRVWRWSGLLACWPGKSWHFGTIRQTRRSETCTVCCLVGNKEYPKEIQSFGVTRMRSNSGTSSL